MDQKNLRSDPCDNRIIRFNNFMQLLSCVCQILAIFIEELREAADIIRIIAHLVYCATSGCMIAQMFRELDEAKGPYSKVPNQSSGVPPVQTMNASDVSGSKPSAGYGGGYAGGVHQQSNEAKPAPVAAQAAGPTYVQATPVAQAMPVAQATPVLQTMPVAQASGTAQAVPTAQGVTASTPYPTGQMSTN